MKTEREALLERLLHTERRLHMVARTEADKQRELLDKYRLFVEQWTQLDPSVADNFIKAFELFINQAKGVVSE